MSYINFNLDRACRTFSLTLNEKDDLFGHIPAVPVSALLRSILDENVPLAVDVNTEKMRSEFILAPILTELRRLTGGQISLFSGIEFNVSEADGLNGVCDFILSQSPLQLILRAPVLTIVEAKKEDIKAGLGQCAAEMVAARLFNEREGEGPTTIHGAVTTGTNWRFLKLESNNLQVDRQEYFLEPVGKILAILLHCVGGDPAAAGAAA
jgi:hypothetical protein